MDHHGRKGAVRTSYAGAAAHVSASALGLLVAAVHEAVGAGAAHRLGTRVEPLPIWCDECVVHLARPTRGPLLAHPSPGRPHFRAGHTLRAGRFPRHPDQPRLRKGHRLAGGGTSATSFTCVWASAAAAGAGCGRHPPLGEHANRWLAPHVPVPALAPAAPRHVGRDQRPVTGEALGVELHHLANAGVATIWPIPGDRGGWRLHLRAPRR
eukprot:scaffold86399_cov74-Phaeocystis_antarctica.AAC.1